MARNSVFADMASQDVTAAEFNILDGSDSGPLSHRNMIINGEMQIAQRGTSFTSLGNGDSKFTLDRWKYVEEGTTASECTISQSSDVPSGQGFSKSLYLDVTTASGSLDSGHIQYLRYAFEGQDLQRLAYGTSSAKSMTLSFWAKSPLTGIHVVSLRGDSSSNNRTVSGTYTIASANTWEKHTITFPGDTSGTIANDNSAELEMHFYLSAGTSKTSGTLSTTWVSSNEANRAVGQVNVMVNTSYDFYLTGVQLELGSQASLFEHRSYGEELARGERYCQTVGMIAPLKQREYDRSRACHVHLKTTMRANCTVPAITTTDGYNISLSNQSQHGFHCYYVANADGVGGGINSGTIVTA